ncbi:hypothetical protein [Polymorphobacter multimanifer]|uniref:hypothetical protein n=1 Tax=Polymorphobacter multimanifer TaxID=1070431 RepID=UPI0016647C55|nr:hypothetical protein [Polymorphobacter multimanifer]
MRVGSRDEAGDARDRGGTRLAAAAQIEHETRIACRNSAEARWPHPVLFQMAFNECQQAHGIISLSDPLHGSARPDYPRFGAVNDLSPVISY